MKGLKKYIISSILTLFSSYTYAENGDWTIYASYHHATKAIKVGTKYYVLANGSIDKDDNDHLTLFELNNLYVYDKEDNSLGSYDKTNALSDYGIYDIAYSKDAKKFVIVYNNGNIDIMNSNGGCVNLPDFKNKPYSNKNIKNICIAKDKAYVSTEAGLIVINIRNCYFENLYNLGLTINSALVSDDNIYATTKEGIYVGNLSENLLDIKKWKLKSIAELSDDKDYAMAINENTLDTAALKVVSGIIPNSPKRNYTYRLRMYGEKLLIAGGNNYYPKERSYLPTIMCYQDNKWSAFDEKVLNYTDEIYDKIYRNITDVIQDPNDPTHHFATSKGGGLFEFKNNKFVKNYSLDNSPLKSALDKDNPRANLYVRLAGLQYDKDDNLWLLNCHADTVIQILKKNGKWKGYYYPEIANHQTFDNTMIDSRGYIWINSRRTTNDGHESGMLIIDTNGTIDTQKDDRYRYIKNITNQDGNKIDPVDLWTCATEDLDGNVWMGNDRGIFVCNDVKNIFNSNQYLTQIKVSRNDGTNFADYLLADVAINCITIDGGNRKWIGTASNGVYLVSADGQEIIEHFTIENSSLISNNINDVAINGTTGEVFIATDMGLCSYMGNATDPSKSMDDSTLKVYPNPVRPEYNGDVNVTGLMYNSDVKIVNAAGKLVYSGTSNGGMFTWNCCNSSGKKCVSGIYYALCTDENGKEGACAKILIIK